MEKFGWFWFILSRAMLEPLGLSHLPSYRKVNPIRPGLFSRSPGLRGEGGGGLEARWPKIKVKINRLKWNFAWVIIFIKAFLMQNLKLIALLVLEIWRHKIPSKEGNDSSISAIYPWKTSWTLKKKRFYAQNRSSLPTNSPTPMSIQQFSSRGNFFSFSKFLGRLDEKRAAETLSLMNFAKIWS